MHVHDGFAALKFFEDRLQGSELAKMGGLLSVTAPIGDQVISAKAGIQLAKLVETSPSPAQHVPASFPTCYRIERNRAVAGARVVYEVDGSPVLTLNMAEGRRVITWDPADVMFKENASLAEDWGGSGAAYALVAECLFSCSPEPAPCTPNRSIWTRP